MLQVGDAEDIKILQGVVSKDHIHMHIEYPPSQSIREIVRRIRGRTSRCHQERATPVS
uniref:transposase n=1 Tax=Pseudocalidococcus azoricus TaxID=3110322 RepID=UPI002AF6C102|nr:transposase [Pseudocalidococcus azoricus]